MATASAVPVPGSHLDVARDAEPATKAANAALAARLPFAEQSDFEAARRGLIAAGARGHGEVGERHGAVEPGRVRLHRRRARAGHGQSQPVAHGAAHMANGLFKVTERLYQLRGFDMPT